MAGNKQAASAYSCPTGFKRILLSHFLYLGWHMKVAKHTTVPRFLWVLEGPTQVLPHACVQVLHPLDRLSCPLLIFLMASTTTMSIIVMDYWAHSHECLNPSIFFRVLIQTKVTLLPKVVCFISSIKKTRMVFFLKIFL